MADIADLDVDPAEEQTTYAFGYNLASLRPMIAQWDATLADSDLSAASGNGLIYNKALAELQEALFAAHYQPDLTTPIAYQRCHDILTLGVCLYYIEGHTMISYQDGYSPIAGAFSRYRNQLRDIAAGGQLGELNTKAKTVATSCHHVRQWGGYGHLM